ncbi:MAG: 16S rRNA (uracil(1498)-N(3))-methyltransferase [Chitinophagaceae bacterium]|nr:16S rRNA (uracil(1498)-N(3))-methyltransferase [Chitinophagaceae bacterium]
MALPFFYEPTVAVSSSLFELSEETSKHCIQVLRMRTGEQLQLTNGKGGLYTARIANEDKKHCTVTIESEKQNPPPEKKTIIAVSLLKNASRFEWFLEKATEVGITEIVPLICTRTEHIRFRFDRMQQIVISAMLQSQQSWLPILHEPVKFQELVQQNSAIQKLIAHCEEDSKSPIQTISLTKSVLILIGPEGDFTPEEIKLAIHHSFQPVSLGNTRLRTETAAMVASTFLSIR